MSAKSKLIFFRTNLTSNGYFCQSNRGISYIHFRGKSLGTLHRAPPTNAYWCQAKMETCLQKECLSKLSTEPYCSKKHEWISVLHSSVPFQPETCTK